ncbi:4'-phosphopantetheinyl transferase family protein [Halotalea alkalilenta]|uniref:4'-phosphopantetheinyl transferase family protein n=1 Tax=Halotalea alkalilenta TaxID=376489 RepID=UPI00069474EA|nr:4'-phosphopantetheinyl transferase superfamily protein [Halotalea alkalilenta]
MSGSAVSPSIVGAEQFLQPLAPSQLLRIEGELIGELPLAIAALRFTPGHFDAKAFERLRIPAPDALAKAIDKRRAEYLAARLCARRALAAHAIEGLPWTAEGERCPQWPGGCIGALTHSQGFAAAAVAAGSQISALGIDAEGWIHSARADRLAEMILCDSELDRWRELPELARGAWLTRVFSAKESLYKALYPRVKRPFYIHDAIADFDPTRPSRFTLGLVKSLDAHHPDGFSVEVRALDFDRGVLTLIALPA